MANTIGTQNPWILDTAGDVVGITNEVRISGIVINASADTWSIILKDGAGNIVFQATQPLVNDRFKVSAIPFSCMGLRVDTATNITNCLVYRQVS